MPDQDTAAQDDLAAHVGGATFPKTRGDVDKLVEEGVALRERADNPPEPAFYYLSEIADHRKMNGREIASYAIGVLHERWRVERGTAHDQQNPIVRLCVKADHLPAVLAVLINIGASVGGYSTNQEAGTQTISVW